MKNDKTIRKLIELKNKYDKTKKFEYIARILGTIDAIDYSIKNNIL